ncbi:cyclic nucleotide-binding protein [bacterium 336/3]|nr:cyclic nucleotide-binding protein [bacterium 336/3]
MLEKLYNLISQKSSLAQQDKILCEKYFEPVLLPKNRIIEEEGKIPKYLYFIVEGYLRLFYYDREGNEITTHINCPPGFITAYFDFIHQTKATENLECITESQLLRITKEDLDVLMEQSQRLKDFSIWVFQQSIIYNEQRTKDLATLTAEQRYFKLMENYPTVLHNVPLQYIASFLGMNPKSLSRIRKQIIR